MFRYLFASLTLVAALAFSGCCTGPGCGPCGDACGGCGPCGHVAHRPLDGFRQWRRGLSCQSGCCETYVGEWRSTPPDCVDPCPEFVDDCGTCVDVCHDCGGHCGVAGGCGIRPLRATARLVKAIYGKRICCDCGYYYDDCACGEPSVYDSYGSGCGCSSCSGETITGDGGCASGNCSLSKKSGPQPTPVQMARQHQRSRQNQMARRPAMNRPATNTQTAQATSAEEPAVRQAQRIPEETTGQRR